jgi:DNA-binding response OmpR family regulator
MADTRNQNTMPRILIIDDDGGVRETLEIMLQEAGFNVLMARDGNQGLDLFLAHPVDLVITDMLMPLKSGDELISEMRHKNPHVPIIAMSGGSVTASGNPLTAARQNGADRIIGKPFDYDDLNAQIRELLPARAGGTVGAATDKQNTAAGR